MKTVLLYFPDTIFPLNMANRVRVYEKIKFLSQTNSIIFISLVDNDLQKKETVNLLSQYCTCFFIERPTKKSVLGVLLRFKWRLFDYIGIFPIDYQICNGGWHKKSFKQLALNIENVDAVIVDYWFGASSFFNYIKKKSINKIVDTHNLLSSQRELELNRKKIKVLFPKLWLRNYKKMEADSLKRASVLLAISKNEYNYYSRYYSKVYFVPIGVNMIRLKKNSIAPIGNTVLFYGNLGDNQNIIAFDRLWNNIFPLIKKRVKDARLLIVGGNPTQKQKGLSGLDYVTVTGFVAEPLEFIAQAKVHIIPMETASGFRGRIPESMGIGVPAIGTHNALDCMGFNEKLSFLIADKDEDIAELAINLLTNQSYWEKTSALSKEFIEENYSSSKIYKAIDNYL